MKIREGSYSLTDTFSTPPSEVWSNLCYNLSVFLLFVYQLYNYPNDAAKTQVLLPSVPEVLAHPLVR